MNSKIIPTIVATSESLSGYGVFLGQKVIDPGLSIPFYDTAVQEGNNIPFEHETNVVIRTARINRRDTDLIWLERHMKITQVFIGLGNNPFAMVLGLPTHQKIDHSTLPDIASIRCFIFEPGTGILINKGTWHDFPLAIESPVTCLIINSQEVIEALTKSKGHELDDGDVYKIKIKDRLNTILTIDI